MKKLLVIILCLLPYLSQAQTEVNEMLFSLVYKEMPLNTSSLIPPLFSEPSLKVSSDIVGGKKNVGIAVLFSLLVPGMGEIYAGDYSTGKYFTTAEVALLVSYLSMQLYGDWLLSDVKSYAATRANVQLNGKDDQFFIDIGNHLNVYMYNEYVLRRREIYKLYDPASHYWSWLSDVEREHYRRMRVQARQVINNSQFCIAAIVANHILSAINAASLVLRYNEGLSDTINFELRTNPVGRVLYPHGLMLTLNARF